MKIANGLALFLLCATLSARADWMQDYEADSREAKQTDLDAVPGKALVNEDPDTIREEKQKQEAFKAEQKRQYDQENWLVEAYQEREQALEKNEDAAADDADSGSVKPHDEANGSLRSDPSLRTDVAPGSPSSLIKPFLTGAAPMSSLPTAAPPPFLPPLSATLSYAAPNPVTGNSAGEPPPVADPAAIDIPGMTAAESDPARKSAADVGPDDLAPDTMAPGQNPNDKVSQPLELELPVAKNSEQLQQLQKQAMGLPETGTKKADAVMPGVVSVAPAPLPPRGDEDERVAAPESMHNRVADPFDILR